MELVDLSAEPWRKVAFYSSEEAAAILTQLYDRWERHRRNGTPLDYATEEELERLLAIAEGIEPEDVDSQQARMLITALYGEEALEEVRRREREERRPGRLKRILRVLSGVFFHKPW